MHQSGQNNAQTIGWVSGREKHLARAVPDDPAGHRDPRHTLPVGRVAKKATSDRFNHLILPHTARLPCRKRLPFVGWMVNLSKVRVGQICRFGFAVLCSKGSISFCHTEAVLGS